MTRRELLGVLAASSAVLKAEPSKQNSSPVCVHSRALAKVGYAELGDIARQLGFDGVDLTVMPGGHVEPSMAPVDLIRAIESVQGADLEVPIISTALTSPAEPWSRTVLALSGHSGVGLFKPGPARRSQMLQQTRRDYFGLAMSGREFGIALVAPVGMGTIGFSPTEALAILSGFDPQWSGISLSTSCFAKDSGISEDDLNSLLPRVRALAVHDLVWKGTPEWRPLGEGSVDFKQAFKTLSRAGFQGPISVLRDYVVKDEPGSLVRDLTFLRKQIAAVHES